MNPVPIALLVLLSALLPGCITVEAPVAQAVTEAPTKELSTDTDAPLATPLPTETAPPARPVASTTVEETVFLDVVRQEVPSLANAPGDRLVALGYQTCDVLDSTSPTTSAQMIAVINVTTADTGVSPREGQRLFGAAIAAFCPEWIDVARR